MPIPMSGPPRTWGSPCKIAIRGCRYAVMRQPSICQRARMPGLQESVTRSAAYALRVGNQSTF